MKQDIEDLKTAVTKLRLDLIASNMAHAALISVLTADQQRQALKALAELSVMQEQTAEKVQKPEVIALLQASMQRMYSMMEGSHKMRMPKMSEPPETS